MSLKIKINQNYTSLKPSYLFSDIGKRVRAFAAENPNAQIIRLGIGDVTLPLPECTVKAMEKAAGEMGNAETFRGYPPEYGYDFLKEAIAKKYAPLGVSLKLNEIFVSDGAKSDVGNITDIIGDTPVCIPDPVYPVYLDSNIMDGREIAFVKGNTQNSFLPTPGYLEEKAYIIYLCSPNNPTGAVYDRKGLKEWVDFACKTGSLIIFDAAYEAFIDGDCYPRSIYEIGGARSCAVEICSFSKFAGFTGTRCAWCVFPEELECNGISLNFLWSRRQATKFNGVSYIIQRGAEAALTDEGIKQCMESIAYYRRNAKILTDCLEKAGVWFTGGKHSPYLWLKCPGNMGSWEFFDLLLSKAQIVGTPGEGFGECGKGFFRLTSFGSYENTNKAAERLEKFFKENF
jgi:LL-diaminopimelate aminotransferase